MEEIMSFVENLDPTKLLPDLGKTFADLYTWIGIVLKAGPVVLLVTGLVYLLRPPKEANHKMGFRTPFGMGSVSAWKFTQKIAGAVWTVLGLVLLIIAFAKNGSLQNMEMMDCVTGAMWVLFGQAICVAVAWLALNIVPAVFFDWKGNARSDLPEKLANMEKKPILPKKIVMKLRKRSEGPSDAADEKPRGMEHLDGAEPASADIFEPEEAISELPQEFAAPEEAAEAPEAEEERPPVLRPEDRSDSVDEIFEDIKRSINEEEE